MEEAIIYGKRTTNSLSHHQQQQQQQTQQQQQQQQQPSDSYCWYHPVHSSSGGTIQSHSQTYSHGSNIAPPNLVQMNQLSSYGQQQMGHSSLDDEWKNIHVMLNCILGMVEKTKRALVILQKRGCSSPAAASPLNTGLISMQNGNSNSSSNACTNGSQVDPPTGDRDGNLKRLSGEIVAQTIRATEDRIAAQVKRRAEEAVQEVKRVAMAQVHRAVAEAVAESRANERLRVHQLLDMPLSQRNQSSFLRLSNQVDSGVEMTSEISVDTPTGSSLPGDDEKETVQLTNVVGSVSIIV